MYQIVRVINQVTGVEVGTVLIIGENVTDEKVRDTALRSVVSVDLPIEEVRRTHMTAVTEPTAVHTF